MAIRANKKDNSKRKTTGGGPRPDNTAHKRTEAKERQDEWAKLTPHAQLALLDRRLGKGVGAVKQRARIQARIDGMNLKPREMPLGANPPPGALDRLEAGGKTVPTHLKAKERRERERQGSSSK